MSRFLCRTVAPLFLLAVMLLVSPAHAAITVIDYYRLGDADPGAANGATATATAVDSGGAKPLTRIGSPTYTNGIALAAAQQTGSQLAVNFSGSTQGLSNGILSAVTDNFGIEAWARPTTVSGSHSIAYNGTTSTSGWGLYQTGSTYQGLFGGATFVGSGIATLNGWTHLALVRAGGTTTLYVNGVSAGTTNTAPVAPAGGFCIGMPGQGGATENFNGQIDEVRVFTFTAGQFSTNDLLLNAPATNYPVTLTAGLQTDVNANGRINPGDTLRYTVVITNTTTGILSNTVFNAPGMSNATLVAGSIKAAPLARSDAPIANSVPGNAFHGAYNSTLTVTAVSGLLSNDFVGSPAATITSFGGGSFGANVTAHAAGTTANTAGVGALTVNGDGSLAFVPASGFTGPTTFQYRLANSVGTNDASATIAIGNRPVASNDTYNVTGNTLLDTSLIPQTILANDSGDNTGISGNTAPGHGTVNLSANGNFTYNPTAGYTGADSFTYTLTNGFGPVIGAVNLTVTNKIWYIDNASVAAEEGRSSTPYRLLATFNGQNDGAANHPADNDLIFIRQGNSNYANGIILRNGQKLIGDGSSGTLAAAFGFAFTPGSARAAGVPIFSSFTGTDPVIVNANPSGNGITLSNNNTLRGVTVSDTPNGYGYSGIAVNNLTISESSKLGLGGGINISASGVLAVAFDTLTSSNAPAAAINLNNCSGSFTATAGRIDNPVGTAFANSGSGASLTYPGNITKNNAGRIVDIQSRLGGTITLSGNLTNNNAAATGINIAGCSGGTYAFSGASKQLNTSANTAVTLANNAGATINFTPGSLAITTTSGNGFNATGGGTVSVQGPGNSISSGIGTALNVANTTIAAGGLTFQSISSSGGTATGIILDTTGNSGGLTVTGTGSAGSGGTIASKAGSDGSTSTGIGIYLNSTMSASFNWMQLNDFQNYGIYGTTVNGFGMTHCIINGVNGTSASGIGEGSAYFTGLSGSAGVSNCSVSGGKVDNFHIFNDGAQTLNRIILDTVTFGTMDGATGNDGLTFEGTGGTLNVTVVNSTFTSARGDMFQINTLGTLSCDLVFTNNILINSHTNIVSGGGGVTLGGGGPTNNVTFTYNISSNVFRGALGAALAVFKGTGTGANFNGTIARNTIGQQGATGSGSKQGDGISVFLDDAGTNTVAITSNHVSGVLASRAAIDLLNHNKPAGQMTAVIQGNIIDTLDQTSAFAGIYLQTGSGTGASGDNNKSCFTIGGAGALKNSIDAGANPMGAIAAGIVIEQEGVSRVGLLGSPNYSGGVYADASVQTYVAANTTLTGNNAQAVYVLHDSSSPVGGGFFGTCPP